MLITHGTCRQDALTEDWGDGAADLHQGTGTGKAFSVYDDILKYDVGHCVAVVLHEALPGL